MKSKIVSQNETRDLYFSETFSTSSGKEPTEEEIREQLLFRNNNPTFDCHYILCDIWDNKVKQGRSALVRAPNFGL